MARGTRKGADRAWRSPIHASGSEGASRVQPRLAAIGRNVNQIAHALNLDLQQSGQLRASVDLVYELATLKQLIAAHTDRVMALCAESTLRWRGTSPDPCLNGDSGSIQAP